MKGNPKKLLFVLIPVALLVIAALLIPNIAARIPQISASADQIESITIYYSNEGSRKVVDTREDILAVLEAINNSRLFGSYTSFPTGGQSFLMLFQFGNGSYYSCVYYQTAQSSGYYSDGVERLRLFSLDLASLWESLSCPAVRADAEAEFSAWPGL